MDEARPMKKHTFLSHIFWTVIAVLTGITVSSARRSRLKPPHRYIASAGTTFTYTAERLPESVFEKMDKETVLVGRRLFGDRHSKPVK